MIRVLVADDHPVVRAGLGAVIAEQDDLELVAEAENGATAVALFRDHRPDVALMDLRMPVMDGVEAIRAITAEFPDARILALTTYEGDADIRRALEAGASGYLLKDTDPGRLPFALRGVLEGEAALPRGLVARLIEEFRTRGKRRRLPLMRQRGVELTEREWEVLEFLHDGMSTAEIAERMSISPVTVRRHVSEILKKLRVSSREEAVQLFGGEGSPS